MSDWDARDSKGLCKGRSLLHSPKRSRSHQDANPTSRVAGVSTLSNL